MVHHLSGDELPPDTTPFSSVEVAMVATGDISKAQIKNRESSVSGSLVKCKSRKSQVHLSGWVPLFGLIFLVLFPGSTIPFLISNGHYVAGLEACGNEMESQAPVEPLEITFFTIVIPALMTHYVQLAPRTTCTWLEVTGLWYSRLQLQTPSDPLFFPCCVLLTCRREHQFC